MDKFKVGQLVEGVITRLTKFGAFARLEGDLEGLIHISEISENRIEHPKEAGLHEGDVVTLRVIRIDPDQRRIGLSLRKVDSGAFKDLDLKQISLEGVSLEMAEDAAAPEMPPHRKNRRCRRILRARRATDRRRTPRRGNPRIGIPKPGFSRNRVFQLPMQPPLIVDAHEDLAYNMLTFGRDYTRSVAETRRIEIASGSEAPEHNGQTLLGWPEYQRGRVAVVFSTLFATPVRRKTDDWDKQAYADYNQAHQPLPHPTGYVPRVG